METTLPVNAQTSPIDQKECPIRNTDVLMHSFTGSRKGRKKIICFITKIAILSYEVNKYKFHLVTGEPTCTRSEGDMYKNLLKYINTLESKR